MTFKASISIYSSPTSSAINLNAFVIEGTFEKTCLTFNVWVAKNIA